MTVKTQISNFIRYSGLEYIADKCRFYFKYGRFFFINRRFIQRHQHFAFPPPYFLYETYALNYKDYYEDGFCAAKEIIDFIAPHIELNRTQISILDWGCGPGRIVRHLPQLLKKQQQVYGCDYNEGYIKWCNKNIPGITFLKNNLNPPATFAGNSFDCIYGLSILTHLSLANHIAWIAELRRLLKAGGLLLLTTQGSMFLEKLLPSELIKFNNGELVVRNTKKEGHRVYAAFQPEKFMRKLLADFEIIKYASGYSKESIVGTQDTWLVRKPFI